MTITTHYKDYNDKRSASALARCLITPSSTALHLDFTSNDYLGLKNHPLIKKAVKTSVEKYGVTGSASRLAGGNTQDHQLLESTIAADLNHEAALLFASGYQANISVLDALLDQTVLKNPPLVFCDRLNHHSLHKGCQQAGARQIRYNHLDMNHLIYCLEKEETSFLPKFVITESVFSMDGDCVDLDLLIDICTRYNAFLYIDEAHAVGMRGKKGYGLCGDHLGVGLTMGTFSKALGCFGAYAATSKVVKDYLLNRCGGFIYTTALPPCLVAGIAESWALLPTLTAEREHTQALSIYLRENLKKRGYSTGSSETNIIPILIGGAEKTMEKAASLSKVGINVAAIRPPTVPINTGRLRVNVRADHTKKDIDRLLSNL